MSTNRIVAALSASSRERLLAAVSRAQVPRGRRLYEAGAKITHLYFIESGLVSLVKPMMGGRSVEITAVGREGIAPPTAIFGISQTIMDSIVQIPANVLSIELAKFRALLAEDAELARHVQTYLSAALAQLVQTAACNVLHSVEARCARWLLVARDSALADAFPITHDFLANLLGVRRESVSIAAAALQSAGLIRYSHGKVTVTDVAGLERAACECYLLIRRLFDVL